MNIKINRALLALLFAGLLSGCVWENIRKPWVPHVSAPTSDLTAVFTESTIDKTNAKHWDTVDYVVVPLNTVQKGNLYTDGYLNMNGMFNGAENFKPELRLKASYNNDNIYILAQWTDETLNARLEHLYFNGKADGNKNDADTGWTSQGNCDNLTLLFYQNDLTKGDAWKWGTAYSAPIGKAIDLSFDNGVYTNDAGNYWMNRNSDESGARVMPLYEWNGETQEYILPSGNKAFLDPSYYLLDQHKIAVEGDAVKGRKAFENSCGEHACHGVNGSGEGGGNVYGPAIDLIEYNRYSRQALEDAILDGGHDGASYYKKLNDDQKLNVLAAMRSVCGFPGYYITSPEGSVADVSTISSIFVERN
ncbi:MAG: hypothetical protein ACPGLV_17245 [Bacteroidia bacterium]